MIKIPTIFPAIFFGHGSPMNAVEANKYTVSWAKVIENIPQPKAILAISAHWFVDGVFVTDNLQQKTIHDFYGFPKKLFDVRYDAVGDVELAKKICQIIPEAKLNSDWGIDHGAWSVLLHLYPQANIPVVQLSIDRTKTVKQHYELAKKLRKLREENVLIIGSGNVVHNLARIDWSGGKAYDWAAEFNEGIKKILQNGDYAKIIDYQKLSGANLAVPTPEHFLPLVYILGLQKDEEVAEIFIDGIELGSIGMMGVVLK